MVYNDITVVVGGLVAHVGSDRVRKSYSGGVGFDGGENDCSADELRGGERDGRRGVDHVTRVVGKKFLRGGDLRRPCL